MSVGSQVETCARGLGQPIGASSVPRAGRCGPAQQIRDPMGLMGCLREITRLEGCERSASGNGSYDLARPIEQSDCAARRPRGWPTRRRVSRSGRERRLITWPDEQKAGSSHVLTRVDHLALEVCVMGSLGRPTNAAIASRRTRVVRLLASLGKASDQTVKQLAESLELLSLDGLTRRPTSRTEPSDP
jgi:hypothetical protein